MKAISNFLYTVHYKQLSLCSFYKYDFEGTLKNTKGLKYFAAEKINYFTADIVLCSFFYLVVTLGSKLTRIGKNIYKK